MLDDKSNPHGLPQTSQGMFFVEAIASPPFEWDLVEPADSVEPAGFAPSTDRARRSPEPSAGGTRSLLTGRAAIHTKATTVHGADFPAKLPNPDSRRGGRAK